MMDPFCTASHSEGGGRNAVGMQDGGVQEELSCRPCTSMSGVKEEIVKMDGRYSTDC